MKNNDYFVVAYKLLDYLKDCYENGQKPNFNKLQSKVFQISDRQFVQTLQMLLDDGYIKGIRIDYYMDRTYDISGMENLSITSNGLQYLSENSMMRKAYNFVKELTDWVPLFKLLNL